MRVTKSQVQANRVRIIETASKLFRERGYDGIGIADLMAAAGLTHGGFYRHFSSKADLMAEAATCGFLQATARNGALDTIGFVRHNVSREHRDSVGDGCMLASLCGDAARQPESIKEVFASGVEGLLATLGEGAVCSDEVRSRLIDVVAQVVGAILLSRACPDESPLADEILDVCRTAILSRLGSPV